MFQVGDIVRIIASKPKNPEDSSVTKYINCIGRIKTITSDISDMVKYPYEVQFNDPLFLDLCFSGEEIELVKPYDAISDRIRVLYSKCKTTAYWSKL